jgi:hypothetical protein
MNSIGLVYAGTGPGLGLFEYRSAFNNVLLNST